MRFLITIGVLLGEMNVPVFYHFVFSLHLHWLSCSKYASHALNFWGKKSKMCKSMIFCFNFLILRKKISDIFYENTFVTISAIRVQGETILGAMCLAYLMFDSIKLLKNKILLVAVLSTVVIITVAEAGQPLRVFHFSYSGNPGLCVDLQSSENEALLP